MREDLSQVLDQVRKVANETVPQGGRVFLFGSRARGDFRADSDWDFLVILQKDRIEKSDYDSVIYPLTLLGWKLGLDFVPVIYTENDWNNRKGTLFYHNVQTELNKNYLTMNEEERRVIVDQEMVKALKFLTDAEELARLEMWNVVANRAYYALYHAVMAMMVNDGFLPKNS